MKSSKLFEKYILGDIELSNRIVMSPMTRSRAIGNVPNALMAEYYAQRAGAGLIITEGTSPSANGLGYARIPGIFSDEQIEGWKKTTNAVHEKGGKIFVQLMHTGRVSSKDNLPKGAICMAPSAVKLEGTIWADSAGMIEHDTPKEMSAEDIESTKQEYVQAAKNAISAGFDGVELHGANGYLLEQFLSPHTNRRVDQYGGSIEKRCRFVLEVASAVSTAIGKERTGIRLSPYGAANGMLPYPEIEETYKYLAQELNRIGLPYVHLVDHSSMGAPEVPTTVKETIREEFVNTLILAGGYDRESAESDIAGEKADLIAIGRPFINNPDFVDRIMNGKPLATELFTDMFYSADAKGYTDYPVSH
jgi:N-ethylmaleimide reductase